MPHAPDDAEDNTRGESAAAVEEPRKREPAPSEFLSERSRIGEVGSQDDERDAQ